jgi:Phosphoinositide phospholipase C, Ca2+-dependent
VNRSWPTLDSMKGKFVFVLTPEVREQYYEVHPGLEGALAFTSGPPEAAGNDTNLLFLQMADDSLGLDGAKGNAMDASLENSTWIAIVRP